MEKTLTPAEPGTEQERRIPIVDSCEMALQAHGFREELLGIEPQLEHMGADDRSLVRVAVGRLAAKWIGLHGPSHRVLIGEAAIGEDTVRVDIHSEPETTDPEFWDELIRNEVERPIVSWALDRRRQSAGVWAVLPRTG
jgi:hypothetical protein